MIFGEELPTERKSFVAAGLEDERNGGEDGEETARHDEVDDVVERFATQAKSEGDAGVGRLAAFVPRLRHVAR